MSRRRFQRGTLRISVPAHGGNPERKLPRGTYWGTWYRYVRQPDGAEARRHREKVITRELAEKHGIAKDYTGPLAKSDAQRVLDLLIAQDAGTYVPPDTAATVAMLGKEYLALSEPNWGPHMVRSAGSLVTKHTLNGMFGARSIADITESDLQGWINGYVNAGASKSLLKGLLLHTRAIWKHARKKKDHRRKPDGGSSGQVQTPCIRAVLDSRRMPETPLDPSGPGSSDRSHVYPTWAAARGDVCTAA
jgi:hypothetical protein